MTLRRSGAMDECEARTQGAAVAALLPRPRTQHRAVQRVRATQGFISVRVLRDGFRMTLRRSGVMGECEARTQGAAIAALLPRLRTKPRAAQHVQAIQGFILKPSLRLWPLPGGTGAHRGRTRSSRRPGSRAQ